MSVPRILTRFAFGCFEAAAFLVILCTILGFFGGFWFGFDLLSHFRWQYAGFLLVFCATGYLFRSNLIATLALAAALLNLALIVPFYIPPFGNPNLKERGLRVLSWNVLTSNPDPGSLQRLLTEFDPDVIFLMEVNERWKRDCEKIIPATYKRVVAAREDNFGVAAFSRLPGSQLQILKIGQAELPSVQLKAKWRDQPWIAIFTHPPPPVGAQMSLLRDEQLAQIAAHADSSKTIPMLVVGDLNATPWSTAYRKFLSSTGLRDSAIGFGYKPTWHTSVPFLALPIDHALVSKEWWVIDRKIGKPEGSDHSPILLEIDWVPGGRTPG